MSDVTLVGDWSIYGTVRANVTLWQVVSGRLSGPEQGQIVASHLHNLDGDPLTIAATGGEWMIVFADVTCNNLSATIAPFAFRVPLTTATLNVLTLCSPPPVPIISSIFGSPTGGLGGLRAQDIRDATALGIALLTAPDDDTARSLIDTLSTSEITTVINDRFTGFEVIEGPINCQARGAGPDATASENVSIINQALTEAGSVKGGAILLPFGPPSTPILVNAQLVKPTSVKIIGAGAGLCEIKASTVIAGGVLHMGGVTAGEGDRYGGTEGFTVNANGLCPVSINYAPTLVFNTFKQMLAKGATARNHQIDGTQNSVWDRVQGEGAPINFAILNDAGSNTLNGESLAATDTGVWFGEDTSLPGYTANGGGGFFGHQGPSQNTLSNFLIEYGSANRGLWMEKGFRNDFVNKCNFTNFGNADIEYLIDLASPTYSNNFIGVVLNGDPTEPAFIAPVRNAGFLNYFFIPEVDFGGGAIVWFTGSNYGTILHPRLGGPYRVQHTGPGSNKEITLIPQPAYVNAPFASLPTFGDVAPYGAYATDLHRPVWWDTDSGVYVDPIGSGGGGGGAEFTYTQASPAATWTITNTLGRYPSSVSVWIGDELVDTQIETPDVSTIVVTFASPKSGRAEII